MAIDRFHCESKSFYWSIRNFSMCPQSPGEPICSPEFAIGYFKSYRFVVSLYPRGNETEARDYVSISINGLEIDYSQLYYESVRFSLKILPNYKQVNAETLFDGSFEFKKGICWKRSNLVERKVLLETKRDKLLPNDRLTLTLTFVVIVMKYNTRFTSKSDLESLSFDLEKARETSNHYDLVLSGTGDMLLKAHKAILFCRYPNLAKTLGLQEGQSPELRFCIDSLTLQVIMKYLYSGEMELADVPSGVYDMLDSDDLPHLRNLIFPDPAAIYVETVIRVRRGTFTWKFPQFSNLSRNVNLKHMFCCDELLKWTRIRVQFYFSQDEENEQCISFYVQQISTEVNICLNCKISVVGSSESATEFYFIFGNEAEWKILNFIRNKILIDQKDTLLIKDTLSIKFEFLISDGRYTSKVDSVRLPDVMSRENNPIAKDLCSLKQDLLKLYKNPVFSDVTICVDQVKLPTHKVILCARSPVFCKMFEHDTLEKNIGLVVIEDFDVSVIKELLLYMYCGEFDRETENFAFHCKLYAAADKYEVVLLKALCATSIKRNITVQNAGDVLLFADAHYDVALKKCVHDFVCSNADDVLNSADWNKVMVERSDLATEMLNTVLAFLANKKRVTSSFPYVSRYK